MKCDLVRLALSSELDGEAPPVPIDRARRHLDACAGCRAWLDGATELHRAVRVAPATDVPDLTAAILTRVGADRRQRHQPTWRAALAAVAVLQLAISLPSLLFAADPNASTHVAHELGSWDVALAIGFLFAAWRPARAWGMLPLVAALVVCLLGTTSVDLADGHAHVARELTHVLEVVGLGCLWPLGRRSRVVWQPA